MFGVEWFIIRVGVSALSFEILVTSSVISQLLAVAAAWLIAVASLIQCFANGKWCSFMYKPHNHEPGGCGHVTPAPQAVLSM